MIRKREAGRAREVTVRLPRAQQLYRLYPADEGGYNAALADAELSDGEIIEARAERLGHERPDSCLTATAELVALSDARLSEAAVEPASINLFYSVRLYKRRGSQRPFRNRRLRATLRDSGGMAGSVRVSSVAGVTNVQIDHQIPRLPFVGKEAGGAQLRTRNSSALITFPKQRPGGVSTSTTVKIADGRYI